MKSGTELVSGVSISHENANLTHLETASVDTQQTSVETLLDEPAVDEAFVLETCNRVEAYVVGHDREAGDALNYVTDGVSTDAIVSLNHEESLRHLLRVAAGLESVVLGEDQILGQVRDAYQDARAGGGIGPILEESIIKAIHVGERARSETSINDGTLSLATAAVRLATEECALDGATGLVVGAGEIGELAAKALAEHVDELLVANRTVSRAEHVTGILSVDAIAISLDMLDMAVSDADVVVTATASPDAVIESDVFVDAGETFVVDIARPRDVPSAASDLPNVTVRDLDSLEAVTVETRATRQDAATEVESMVDAELDQLLTQYKRKRADSVIAAMYESAAGVEQRELRAAMSKLDLDDDQEAVIESMADAIVSRLLAPPTESLRTAAEEDDWSTIQTALTLFDPNFGTDGDDGESPSLTEGMTVDEIPIPVRDEMPSDVLHQIHDD